MSTSHIPQKPWPDHLLAQEREAAGYDHDGTPRSTRPLRMVPPLDAPPDTPGAADDPAVPVPLILNCLPGDARAITGHLPADPWRRELPGSPDDAYLDHLIKKPWGQERRVYDDALVDVWMLELDARAQTSKHCHPSKDTLLLCLSGRGVVTDGDGTEIAIAPGSALHIKQGAAHRSLAKPGLTLIEVETPRDKYDLVRLDDRAGRGCTYENEGAVKAQLPALASVPEGPVRARLRPPSVTGPYRFALEQGSDVRRDPADLLFAISLDPLAILRRELALAGPGSLGVIAPEHPYLTIRSTYKEAAA